MIKWSPILDDNQTMKVTCPPSTWHSSPHIHLSGQPPQQQQTTTRTGHHRHTRIKPNLDHMIAHPRLQPTHEGDVHHPTRKTQTQLWSSVSEWVWDLGRPMPGSVSMMTFFGATEASIATTIADCCVVVGALNQSSNPAHNPSAKKSETQNNLPHKRTPDLRSGARTSNFTRNSLDRFRRCQVRWRPARLQHASRVWVNSGGGWTESTICSSVTDGCTSLFIHSPGYECSIPDYTRNSLNGPTHSFFHCRDGRISLVIRPYEKVVKSASRVYTYVQAHGSYPWVTLFLTLWLFYLH